MHSLGPPCALAALFPPGLLRAVASSKALREASSRHRRRAAVWLLRCQVPPAVVSWQGPRRESRRLLLLVPLRRPQGPGRLLTEAALRATGPGMPAGVASGSRPGSQKKLRSPYAIDNNEVLDFLSRVPSDVQVVQYQELKQDPTHSPSRRKKNNPG
uniref:Uncharacterized protein n=1 Tax=Sphaerodactylus townsendi TaxID=933632 RepID=A0ACB8EQL6_9SAUR